MSVCIWQDYLTVMCQQEWKITKSCDLSHDQTMHATYHMTDKVCRKYHKNIVKSWKYMRSATTIEQLDTQGHTLDMGQRRTRHLQYPQMPHYRRPHTVTTTTWEAIQTGSWCIGICNRSSPDAMPRRWKTSSSWILFDNPQWHWMELWHIWQRITSSCQIPGKLEIIPSWVPTQSHCLHQSHELTKLVRTPQN